MKHTLQRLLPLLFFALLLLSCQDDANEHNHEHDNGFGITYKHFKEFKNLPGLIESAVPKNGISRTAKGSGMYDFVIDSTSVMEANSDQGTFYTMAITRDSLRGDIFENLVIADKDTVKEAYIVTYFPDEEYMGDLQYNEHAPYIGGIKLTVLDYEKVVKRNGSNVEQCKNITISFCNYSRNNDGSYHVAGPNCGSIFWTWTGRLCETIFAPDPEPDEQFNLKDPKVGGGGGGGAIPGPPKDRTDVITQPIPPLLNRGLNIARRIEEEIKDNDLDECSKGVLNSLKDLMQNDISNIIIKLDQSPSLYHVTIKTENWPNSNGAVAGSSRTAGFPQYNYTININPETTSNATKLGRAIIILHELVHVYFFSLLDDAGNTDSSVLDNFPQLFKIYVEKQFGPLAVNLHHEIMAEKYVEILARALQEYDSGTPLLLGIEPDQVYKDLAWGSLQDAPVFNTTELITAEDRNRINKRYAAELRNEIIGTESPLGKPCE